MLRWENRGLADHDYAVPIDPDHWLALGEAGYRRLVRLGRGFVGRSSAAKKLDQA